MSEKNEIVYKQVPQPALVIPQEWAECIAVKPISVYDFHPFSKVEVLVDEAFANGYFRSHLDEIECAWIAFCNNNVIGWAAVGQCMLKCIVVHPDYRGMGIGKKLTELRLEYLRGCDRVISHAWVRPDGECMSCKNLENFGFVLEQELEDYYSDTKQNCKYCGDSCSCVARLYVRKNNENC